jgi:hypothetical protein
LMAFHLARPTARRRLGWGARAGSVHMGAPHSRPVSPGRGGLEGSARERPRNAIKGVPDGAVPVN